MKLMKWISLLTLLLVGLAGAGAIYQYLAVKTDLSNYPPSGRLVQVGDRVVHIHCLGEGSPTVIIEPGMSGSALDFTNVSPIISKTTRVCHYDRPGVGYSESSKALLHAEDLAKNLNHLLEAAEIHDEVILLAHSAGGVYSRQFYRLFPGKVVGMVLVDSSHEKQQAGSANKDFLLFKYLAPIGLVRLSGLVERRVANMGRPEEISSQLIATYSQSHTGGALYNESKAFVEDLKEKREPPNLKDLPLVVITRGKPVEEYPGVTPENIEASHQARAAWNKLQQELAALSTNSRHIIAKKSEHDIHLFEPEIVIEEVTIMVKEYRQKPSLSMD